MGNEERQVNKEAPEKIQVLQRLGILFDKADAIFIEADDIYQMLSNRAPGWDESRSLAENVFAYIKYMEDKLELATIRSLDE